MARRACSWVVLAGGTVVALAWWVFAGRVDAPVRAAETGVPAPAAVDIKSKDELPPVESRLRLLRNQLSRPITLDKGFDANTPLKDALDFLSEQSGVTMLIDTEAFKTMGTDAGAQPISLPRMKAMRLSTVLRLLLAQAQATYLLRQEYIEITPVQRAVALVWGEVEQANETPTGPRRPLLPLVQAEFLQRPLDEALKDLTGSTGISVILDRRRADDKREVKVSATFINTPLDTAVRILANQAELTVVRLDNVLVVTTPDNARRLQQQQKKLNQNGLEQPLLPSTPPAA